MENDALPWQQHLTQAKSKCVSDNKYSNKYSNLLLPVDGVRTHIIIVIFKKW